MIRPVSAANRRLRVPPLKQGDRLTREEFERRYEAMPHVKKAELINGVVYMGSPVQHTGHGAPHLRLGTWLGTYCFATPGTDCGDNSSLRLGPISEPQPDMLLRIETACGGRSRMVDGYLEGAPELICEVAASSKSLDLGRKLRDYLRHGIQEYLVWNTREGRFHWFERVEDRFDPLAPDADGVLRSVVFPGLWLDTRAFLADEMADAIRTLRKGLASREHKRFAAQLKRAKAKSK